MLMHHEYIFIHMSFHLEGYNYVCSNFRARQFFSTDLTHFVDMAFVYA